MRIGLTGGGTTADRIVGQASRAEADGFTSMWYPSAAGGGDPLAAMALAGRATSAIELGTAVLVSYACHPVLQASRVSAAVSAIGAPGRLTLGVGPSHRVVIEDRLGLSYDTPGQHTDEYVADPDRAAARRAGELRGQPVPGRGGTANAACRGGDPGPDRRPWIPAAAGGRRLHGRDDLVDGERHGDRDARRTDDPQGRRRRGPARAADRGGAAGGRARRRRRGQVGRRPASPSTASCPTTSASWPTAGSPGPAEAVIVGDEDSVTAQVRALFEAGATDLWAAPFPVGDDPATSRARTRALLAGLAQSSS